MDKKTNEEIADIVAIEGLEYAVTNYLSAKKIKDETLARLWSDAEKALNRIARYLEDYLHD